MQILKTIGMVLALGLLTHGAVYALERDMQDEDQTGIGGTPPRLSFIDGQVSFWRPGAPDWAEAGLNTPLTPGDQLYSGESANLELQIDERSFVRAGSNTQIGLENLESNYAQFKVTAGYVSLDIREIEPGKTVEVDSPNAAFIIGHAGYYRVDVDGEHTSFTVHRSGQATVTPANGEAFDVLSGEQATLDGTTNPQIGSYRAPELDQWDQWGLSRTDQLRNSISSRYVSPGVYGASDLDNAGEWEEVPEYGNVWMPTDVPEGWAPYSSGSWINDPVYGTTWVDTAPWGWAPYHYGRWVSVDGQWAWAPGPPVRRPAYAPALVVFLGDQDGMGRGDEGPVVAWVPLGYGEPLVPWWGPERFHRPWWGGWGGPRVREVEHTGRYRNMALSNGIMMVHEKQFGHGPIRPIHGSSGMERGLRPMQAAAVISKTNASVLPTGKRGIKPPDAVLQRPVVATRPSHSNLGMTSTGEKAVGPTGRALPVAHIVPSPGQSKSDTTRRHLAIDPNKAAPTGSAHVSPPLPSGSGKTLLGTGQKPGVNQLPPTGDKRTPLTQSGGSVPPPPPPPNHRGDKDFQGGGGPQQVGHGPVVPQSQVQGIKTIQPHTDEPSTRHLENRPPPVSARPALQQPQAQEKRIQPQTVEPSTRHLENRPPPVSDRPAIQQHQVQEKRIQPQTVEPSTRHLENRPPPVSDRPAIQQHQVQEKRIQQPLEQHQVPSKPAEARPDEHKKVLKPGEKSPENMPLLK